MLRAPLHQHISNEFFITFCQPMAIAGTIMPYDTHKVLLTSRSGTGRFHLLVLDLRSSCSWIKWRDTNSCPVMATMIKTSLYWIRLRMLMWLLALKRIRSSWRLCYRRRWFVGWQSHINQRFRYRNDPWAVSIFIKVPSYLTTIRIIIIKLRRSHDRLIFIVKIHNWKDVSVYWDGPWDPS